MNLISAVHECSPLFKLFFTILAIPLSYEASSKEGLDTSDLDRDMRWEF